MHPHRMLVIERSIASNHNITNQDVEKSNTLQAVGIDFITSYEGSNTFIPKLQRIDVRYLSNGQIRAALKIMIDEYKDNLPKLPPLHEGRYTVVAPDYEYTIWIDKYEGTRFNVPEGTQSVKLLVGPDNGNDYIPVAFLYPGRKLRMGNSHKHNQPLINAINVLLGSDDPIKFGEAYALKTSNCWRCRRDLTRSKSIIRGVGPECAKKLGLVDAVDTSKPKKQRADKNCDLCLGEGETPDDDLADELGIKDAFYMPCHTCRRQDYDREEQRLRKKHRTGDEIFA